MNSDGRLSYSLRRSGVIIVLLLVGAASTPIGRRTALNEPNPAASGAVGL